jgi:Domain of unknown function (DUF4293)
MIQRQQSLWLLLSTISSFLSFKLPFYYGTVKPDASDKTSFIDAGDNFFLVVLTGAALILSVVTIFLFKDRKLQLKLAIGGAALSLFIIIIYFASMKRFASGGISLWAIFVFAILAGFVMAARGIWKDEKLIKGLDKLR